MPNVSNLTLKLQTGSDNTYFATWDFKEEAKKTSGGSSTSTVKVGSTVTVNKGATYYNGVQPSSWVYDDSFKVVQVKGDRVVLGSNSSGSHNIMSAVNRKDLMVRQ